MKGVKSDMFYRDRDFREGGRARGAFVARPITAANFSHRTASRGSSDKLTIDPIALLQRWGRRGVGPAERSAGRAAPDSRRGGAVERDAHRAWCLLVARARLPSYGSTIAGSSG